MQTKAMVIIMGTVFSARGITADPIVTRSAFRPFLQDTFDIHTLIAPYGADFVSQAEAMLDEPYPQLCASVFMQYVRNGNRSNYETLYFRRRTMLNTFVMAELFEGKGRFTDRIIDGMWFIMEESTWILPAHNWSGKPVTGGVVSLPDTFSSTDEGDDMKHIDLFSAGTGGQMAWLWYITAELLDRENPVIRTRLLSQLHQRILHPFYTYDHDWWMGTNGRTLNNWTPWIISNILTVLALCEEDDSLRRAGAAKSMVILDRYIADLPEDGGCDEGPGYWGVAGGSLFDCLELLYDLSDGKIDVFDEPKIRRFCEYIMNVCIKEDQYINFADAASRLNPDFRMIARMGRKIRSPRLSAFASTIVYRPQTCPTMTAQAYRFYANLAEPIPQTQAFVPAAHTFFDDLQIAVSREVTEDGVGLFLALKGGHNAESHNHNDVGQFILFDRGAPVIMDAGVETYCRDTFSPRRYTLWAMRGDYHNIANINGIEQQPGGAYRAKVLSYDEASGAMTLDLTEAYPAEAGVACYTRSAVLEGSTVTVHDKLTLHAPGHACFRYLTADEPIIEGPTIRFASGHIAAFAPALTASVEPIDLGGGKIAREWRREVLWRITLSTDEGITDGDYTMTFVRT